MNEKRAGMWRDFTELEVGQAREKIVRRWKADHPDRKIQAIDERTWNWSRIRRPDFLDFDCRTCKAKPGQLCRRAARSRWVNHAPRLDAVIRETNRYSMLCPVCASLTRYKDVLIPEDINGKWLEGPLQPELRTYSCCDVRWVTTAKRPDFGSNRGNVWELLLVDLPAEVS
jgi:hypothetical protein